MLWSCRNHQRLQRGTGSDTHGRLGHYLGDAASEMMSFKEIYLFIGATLNPVLTLNPKTRPHSTSDSNPNPYPICPNSGTQMLLMPASYAAAPNTLRLQETAWSLLCTAISAHVW